MNESRRISVLEARVVAVSWKINDRVITWQEVVKAAQPRDSEIAQWLNLFSESISKGESLLTALYDGASTTDNLLLKILSVEIEYALRQGDICSKPVKNFLWIDLKQEAFLIDIGEETGELDVVLAQAAKLRMGQEIISDSCPLDGDKYLLFFYCLSILQDAGLPILRSLKILENNFLTSGVENGKEISAELNMLCDKITNGRTLSEAMGEIGVFGDATVAAIRSGESIGDITKILKSWFK